MGGLLKLFDYVVDRKVDVVAIVYRDRLTGFGFGYLEYFFRQYGVRIEVIDGEEPRLTLFITTVLTTLAIPFNLLLRAS